MKAYEIYDEELGLSVGVLLYYERLKTFIIELSDKLDEWTAPLLFTSFIKKGQYLVPRDISMMWVRERIIPSGRQNIGAILTTHRLKQYDEMKLLELSEGRCSQDSMCIRTLQALPEYVVQRNKKNLTECAVLTFPYILCLFVDGTVEKIDLSKLQHSENLEKVLRNHKLFSSCEIGAGGYYITFNDSIDIGRDMLYGAGTRIPLTSEDFNALIAGNLLDTSQACELLDCSRQNLSYMAGKGMITPVKENVKGNLFLRGDVLSSRW